MVAEFVYSLSLIVKLTYCIRNVVNFVESNVINVDDLMSQFLSFKKNK